MKNEIKLAELPLETLKEMANEAAGLVETHAKNAVSKAIDCGRYLAACKGQVEHGKWLAWLGANFDYTERHAARYMQIAGYAETHNLEQAESISHALRIIADDPATPKRERKEPAASVEVVQPQPTPAEHPSRKQSGDLPDLPKTNTKHTAENRKANPAEQPATRPVSVQAELVTAVDDESSGNAGQLEIAPELLQAVDKTRDGRHLIDVLGEEDPQQVLHSCFRFNPVTAILRFLILSTDEKNNAEVASQLRKAADKLDPPKKVAKVVSVPTAADLYEAIPGDFPDDLIHTTKQWASYKQGRAKGERIQSLDAWRIALKQIWTQAETNGVDGVISKIEKAIANSWKGWDHGNDSKSKTTAGKTGRIKPSSAVPNIEYR